MELRSVYKLLADFPDFLIELEEHALAAKLAEAMSLRGGNRRLAAISDVLNEVKLEIQTHSGLPLRRKTQLAVILNAIKKVDLRSFYTVGSIAEELEGRSVPFTLVAPCGDDEPYLAYEKRFPPASWRFVDWAAVPNSREFKENGPMEIKALFRRCVDDLGLAKQEVFITSGLYEPSFEMDLIDLMNHAELVFAFGTDTLVLNKSADWAFEFFHEGEVGYGIAPLPADSAQAKS